MTSLAEIARDYLGRGFNIIPIRADDRKRPALAAWKPYQERRVTEEDLRRWFGGRSSCGLAVICGWISGALVVVDIDDADLAESVLRANGGLLASTLCARTGGGNLHIYVRAPSAPRKFSLRREEPPLDIDIQGEGSYVVMPPSLHASGRCYEWLPGCGREILSVLSFDVWFQGVLARAGLGWTPKAARFPRQQPAPADSRAAGEIIALLERLTGEAGRTRGAEVWFRCPFHEDWIASLSVNTQRPVWHCFGCGEGGGLARLRRLRRGR